LPRLIAPSSKFVVLNVNPAEQLPKNVLELIEILETRAPSISQEIRDRDARKLFESLHSRNIKALREKQYILSHDITGQIHSLLHQHLPVRYYYRPYFDSDLSIPKSFSDKVQNLSISERYPLFESDVEATKTVRVGSGLVSADDPPGLIPRDFPADSGPRGTRSLDPAGLRPSLSLQDVPAESRPLGGLNSGTRAADANVNFQDTGNRQFSVTAPQNEVMLAEKLIGILGERAAEIETHISESLAGDPRVHEIKNRFLSLHRQNLTALGNGNLALHRDLSAQIHELLLHSVYHVVYRPIVADNGKVTLLEAMASRYPTLDQVNGESTVGQPRENEWSNRAVGKRLRTPDLAGN
jgi:hypothetical protein